MQPLLRGSIDFAAKQGCAAVDLGPGGAAVKLRMGAMTVQPQLMVYYGDWRLRAPPSAANDKELYKVGRCRLTPG